MAHDKRNPQPVHMPGTAKGEEMTLTQGKEAGRGEAHGRSYRSARDSTGINASDRQPIDPNMPNLPPS